MEGEVTMSWFNDICSSVGNAISNVAEKVGDAADAIYVTSEEAAEGENGIFGAGGVITDCLTITEAEANGTEEGSWVHGGIFKESGAIGGAIHTISNGINTVATAVNDYVLKPAGDMISKGWEAVKANPVLGVVALGAAIGVGVALWPVTTVIGGAGVAGFAAGTVVTGSTATMLTAAGLATTTGSVGGALLAAVGTALGLTGLFGLGSGEESSADSAVSGDGILTEADLQLNIADLSDADATSIIELLRSKGYIDESGNILKWPDNASDLSDITDNVTYQQTLFTILAAQKPATEAA